MAETPILDADLMAQLAYLAHISESAPTVERTLLAEIQKLRNMLRDCDEPDTPPHLLICASYWQLDCDCGADWPRTCWRRAVNELGYPPEGRAGE